MVENLEIAILQVFVCVLGEGQALQVAATGHDRTPINIKPEYVDAWLSPESRSDSELQAIFDDKRHPYYEHREAA